MSEAEAMLRNGEAQKDAIRPDFNKSTPQKASWSATEKRGADKVRGPGVPG